MTTTDNWAAVVQKKLLHPGVGEIPHTAKRICGVCPVRTDCLADALIRRDVAFGVLGGLTPNERRRLLRDQTAGADQVRRVA
jgi:hypothetical protein